MNLPNSSGSMYSTAWMPDRYWSRPWMRVLFSPVSLSTHSIICCCLSIQYRWSPNTVRPTGWRMLESWRTIRLAPGKENKEIRRVIIQVFPLCHVINRIFSAFVLGIWLQRGVLLRKEISHGLRCDHLFYANIKHQSSASGETLLSGSSLAIIKR